ncbi:MAG: hypothetical protein J0I47_13875 [Sphingomonas sp.]|uniref:hypothetical protein n=1 Tax=Sphingomonas sp. TaxID=28214 RepID=UPI001AD2BFF5|nr:hypothetical protein [Sphingomonas sp.]MBN8809306.1 hypothetical protein [Sphingomonas sp.]
MTETPSRRWRALLIAAFVAALAFTGYHVARVTYDTIYWSQHRDEPIQRWMTLGYVAHSYHVPPHILHQALGLPPDPDHRPIGRIAHDRGTTVAAIAVKLTDAIVHVRPPYPPPGPPPRPTATPTPR